MGQVPQKNILLGGIDIDTDEKRIQENRATFIKGLRYDVNRNPSAGIGEGSNYGTNTPFEQSVEVTGLTYPAGTNYTIGSYQCKETNELYVFVHNSNDNHFIYRINGVDGTPQMVYKGACLNFQIAPEFYISEGRCVLITDTYTDPVSKEEKIWKFLCFTDNYNPQRMISVEDSIATDSFNPTAFPYFDVSGYDCHPCDLINLGLGTPMKCITITPIDRDSDTEKNKQNLLNNKGWQWRIKYICHWGRESEHGVISDRYFTVIGATCIQTNDGVPRCVKLTIDAGCPEIEQIQIEYRNCLGNSEGSETDWLLSDTIEKYNNCDGVAWYERDINPDLDYDAETNTFDYVFCADKECQAIPISETSRTQNPLPLLSSSLFSIDKGIGLANNVREFDPLDCDELAHVSYEVTGPPEGCTNILRTIVVYAHIWSKYKLQSAPIWDVGTAAFLPDEEPLKGIVWGLSSCNSPQQVYNYPAVYGQIFADGYTGFIGYLAGTNFSAVSEQYRWDPGSNVLTKIGVISLMEMLDNPTHIYLQRFEFKVPPGKYSFRIANHQATIQQDYQKTSTYTGGSCVMSNPGVLTSFFDKEIIIDCCEDDVDLAPPDAQTLLIYDLSYDNCPAGTAWGRIVDGYAYEDRIEKFPIELALISHITVAGPIAVSCKYTDHNGFFFVGTSGTSLDVFVRLDKCTGTVDREVFVGDPENIHSQNVYAMDGLEPYCACGRREIKATFKLCDNDNIGISGVAMVMKYAGFAFSDTNGVLTLIAHQRIDGFPDDVIIRTQRGGCILADCDDPCQTCFDNIDLEYKGCCECDCDSPNDCRNTDLGTFHVQIQSAGLKGLESGGRYGLGITMWDDIGRHGFIQANETHYIDIKSLTETKTFNFPVVSFNISGINFPTWVKYISFYITENLNNDGYLYWVADKVDFIDNSGNINFVSPTKIRIYYASLAEYNLQNDFATNTNWQFVTAEKTSVIGDYVEFITKSQNTVGGQLDWFDKTVTGLVRYDTEGQYFDIDYTEDLKGLKEGALYKLVRPKACITKYIYYEVCSTIRVNDGVPETVTGTLNAFDSYFVSRQIPVPTTGKDINGNPTKTVVTKFYNLSFEHNSPSDFFGYKCANRGRINIKNPYERQKRLGSEVALSKAITNKGSFNGLSYFDLDDVTTFLEQEWGNIVVVIPEINTYLFICEHNNFIAGYKDTIVRIDENNQAVAPSSAGAWGTPQRKIGSDYGCQPFDINTIRKTKGKVIFIDRQRYALLFHDFQTATDVSINGYKSYLNSKIASQNALNLAPIPMYIYMAHAGIDVYSNEYYLTFFRRPNIIGNIGEYTNNLTVYSLPTNETISISTDTGIFKGTPAFTPEYYGTLEGYFQRKNIYFFKNAHPWSARSNGTLFNNFFGTQTKKVIEIVTNISPEKVKKFLYNEVYCKEHKFIIDSIITESGQTSRLKAPWWDNREKFWCAEFLCALNTFQDPNLPILATAALTDGDPLSGQWMKAKYVSEDADDAKYCELVAIVNYVTATDKSAD
jgi:hypothetical protein